MFVRKVVLCCVMCAVVIGCMSNRPLSGDETGSSTPPMTNGEAGEAAEEEELPIVEESTEGGEMQTLEQDQMISAEILLQSASGASIQEDTLITSENVDQYMPAPDTSAIVSQYFTEQGFEVPAPAGSAMSISIVGPAELFTKQFERRFAMDGYESIVAITDSGQASNALPTDGLPDAIRERISIITFSESPDFGP